MSEETIQIHEHGYVRLIETWGSDERIIEAARMSTGKGFLGWGTGRCKNCGTTPELALERGLAGDQCPDGENHSWDVGDGKLLRFLYENHHDTPFEMGGMIIEVQAPIIVFREWHRHRVPWSYNEASARYAPLPAFDYLPTIDRVMRGGGQLTKQAAAGDGARQLTADFAESWLADLEEWQRAGEEIYQRGLQNGIPKELARGAMSVFRYSKMRASANARGWLHFFGLRSKPNAQEEIRLYSEACETLIAKAFPRTFALYAEKKR